MSGRLVSARDAGLTEKYDRITLELERFRRESCPDLADLPREVREMVHFIHDQLFDPDLNVNAVKNRCGLRNNNVSTRFRQTVGLGVRQYIETLRMTAASYLLRDGGLEIYLVAMAVGYEYHESFSRAFQRFFGCPPSEHAALPRAEKK